MRCDFRFQQVLSLSSGSRYGSYLWINVICTVLINAVCKLYTSLVEVCESWRSLRMRSAASRAVVFCTVLRDEAAGLYRCREAIYLSISMLLAICIIGPRFSYRFLRIAYHNHEIIWQSKPVVTMVVGAGAAGYMLVREMKNSKHLNRKVPCIIDDDPQKIGTYLQGIPIVGTKEEIPAMAKKYNIEEIIIAIPTLMRKTGTSCWRFVRRPRARSRYCRASTRWSIRRSTSLCCGM